MFSREGKERLFTELEKLLKKKDEVDQRMKLLGSAFQELEVSLLCGCLRDYASIFGWSFTNNKSRFLPVFFLTF